VCEGCLKQCKCSCDSIYIDHYEVNTFNEMFIIGYCFKCKHILKLEKIVATTFSNNTIHYSVRLNELAQSSQKNSAFTGISSS